MTASAKVFPHDPGIGKVLTVVATPGMEGESPCTAAEDNSDVMPFPRKLHLNCDGKVQTSMDSFSEMTSFSGVGASRASEKGRATKPGLRSFRLVARAAAHAAVLAALGIGDGLHARERGVSLDALAVALIVLYGMAAAMLCVHGTCEWQHRRGHLILRPPWAIWTVLHSAIALTSACWQDLGAPWAGASDVSAVQEHLRIGRVRAAMEMVLLQLLFFVLYPDTARRTARLAIMCLQLVAFVAVDCVRLPAGPRDAITIEGLFLIATASLASLLVVGIDLGSRSTRTRAQTWRDVVVEAFSYSVAVPAHEAEVQDIFGILLAVDDERDPESLSGDADAGSRWSELIHRLILTRAEASRCELLSPVLRDMLERSFSLLLRELKNSAPKVELISAELAEAPQMTKDFVNSELIANATSGFERENGVRATLSETHDSDCWASKAPLTRARREGLLTTFSQNMNDMIQVFGLLDVVEVPLSLSASSSAVLARNLGKWSFDILMFAGQCDGHVLTSIASAALRPHVQALGLDCKVVDGFLWNIESRYHAGNLYHNAIHAADVTNSMQFFLTLSGCSMPKLDALEQLAALAAASAHDVGHDGKANRYHTTAQTPLARLYNDQSPLENMHCSIMFSVLYTHGCDFLRDLDSGARTTFRNLAVQMILDTDLAKHLQNVNHFRQEFLPVDDKPATLNLSAPQRRELLSILLKSCDVGGSTKPFELHAQWAVRILAEFFAQGDAEREAGLPCSPFCDRFMISVAECQQGFFTFIVFPLYSAVSDFLRSKRLKMEVTQQKKQNLEFWKAFDSGLFDCKDPLKNMPQLLKAYCRLVSVKQSSASKPRRLLQASSEFDEDVSAEVFSDERDIFARTGSSP